MFDRKIKNLKLMPTSELIYNTVYNNQSVFYTRNINNVLMKRLLNKYKLNKENAYSIVNKEQEIIIKRGSNITNYIFDVNRGLNGTVEAFYKKLNFQEMNNPLLKQLKRKDYVDKFWRVKAEDLTFSELCLGWIIMNTLKRAYSMRNDLLPTIENEKMIEFYKTLSNIFIEPINEMFLKDENYQKNMFYLLTTIIPTALKITKESSLCISKEEQKLQVEFAAYNDSFVDVISKDKALILKYKETEKIYKKVEIGLKKENFQKILDIKKS
ncbi:MAG TPA: hypothetical protein IAB59_07970 [Candidatus Onthousia faecipullorum]|uniref:Uncharacterized protein n=1 Tax=Candidatus Onthousia faecipullorum TaxID=2840887 RepID=A0A9D1KCQ4_9FIRM|nr:hypothetical protein [Candidatus Onthousia faecipullorum]